MNLEEYKKSLTSPLKQRSLLFLVKDNNVLLGMKKSGFGQGKWVGIGGKVEIDETIEEAAVREATEEIGVIPPNIRRVATLTFYFPHVKKPDHWNQKVCVFIATKWDGEIKESAEIYPKWFHFNEIPFHAMWADAIHWLPILLKGTTLTGSFLFINESDIGEISIKEGTL